MPVRFRKPQFQQAPQAAHVRIDLDQLQNGPTVHLAFDALPKADMDNPAFSALARIRACSSGATYTQMTDFLVGIVSIIARIL